MGLAWGSTAMVYGDMDETTKQEVQGVLDQWADRVADELATHGFPPHASPIFRPFNVTVLMDQQQLLVAFSSASGLPGRTWIHRPAEHFAPSALIDLVANQNGEQITVAVTLPLPDSSTRAAQVQAAAALHASEVEKSRALSKLGDLEGVQHLEPQLREFLNDHPNYDANVFVMMPFANNAQVTAIHEAIKSALAERGMHAVRADDRDYTGELWSNIQVYLTGSKYGIAVFEDIEQTRDFNPNVSLELGYMLGRNKRTLLLKEQRLPNLPVDVVHRLYKPFDMFDIDTSIKREVGRWIDVDLRL